MVNVSSSTLNMTAPHRDIASDQPDCRRLGSKFLWLGCNDPIFYRGKEMAETRVKQGNPATHPIPGDEMRALRKLQREQEPRSLAVRIRHRTRIAVHHGRICPDDRAGW